MFISEQQLMDAVGASSGLDGAGTATPQQALVLVAIYLGKRLEDFRTDVQNQLRDIASNIDDVETRLSEIDDRVEELVKTWRDG